MLSGGGNAPCLCIGRLTKSTLEKIIENSLKIFYNLLDATIHVSLHSTQLLRCLTIQCFF
jgi:hypothetical protein